MNAGASRGWHVLISALVVASCAHALVARSAAAAGGSGGAGGAGGAGGGSGGAGGAGGAGGSGGAEGPGGGAGRSPVGGAIVELVRVVRARPASSSSSFASSSSSASTSSSTSSGTGDAGSGPTNLVVEYEVEQSAAMTAAIGSQLWIVNNGSSAVNLDDLSVRYYFTNEVTAQLTKYIDWANIGALGGAAMGFPTGDITIAVVPMSTPVAGRRHLRGVRLHRQQHAACQPVRAVLVARSGHRVAELQSSQRLFLQCGGHVGDALGRTWSCCTRASRWCGVSCPERPGAGRDGSRLRAFSRRRRRPGSRRRGRSAGCPRTGSPRRSRR